MAVGIIGYGRFGKFIAQHIAERSAVLVFDSGKKIRSSRRIRHAPLHIVASQSIVLIAVPVSALQNTLRSIESFLQPSTLVIDVCAVKARPVEWMRALLPKHVHILGTHPLFGPDSARDSLAGHRMYLTPVRLPKSMLRHVIRELKKAGLLVTVLLPNQHDKLMAETLFLTQFIGRYVKSARIQQHVDSTKSYDALMGIVKIANNDTKELFRDMVQYNAFAKRAFEKLDLAQQQLKKEIAH